MRIKNKLILQSVILVGSALAGADAFFYLSERKHLLAEEASAQASAAARFSRVSAECILSDNDIFLLNYARTPWKVRRACAWPPGR